LSANILKLFYKYLGFLQNVERIQKFRIIPLLKLKKIGLIGFNIFCNSMI